jgi:TrpR-related protein YerC/YecD
MPTDRVRTPGVDRLIEAILALRTEDEVYAFLQDVATVREIQDLAQRLAVARLLADGVHYDRIRDLTGASTTTISRVSRCLYTTVLDRTGGAPAPGADAEGPASS